MVKKAGKQEKKTAAHVVSAVREQKVMVMDAGLRLLSCFLFNSGFQSTG